MIDACLCDDDDPTFTVTAVSYDGFVAFSLVACDAHLADACAAVTAWCDEQNGARLPSNPADYDGWGCFVDRVRRGGALGRAVPGDWLAYVEDLALEQSMSTRTAPPGAR